MGMFGITTEVFSEPNSSVAFAALRLAVPFLALSTVTGRISVFTPLFST